MVLMLWCSIARALRLTAKFLPDVEPWLQGAGVIQVKGMVDELVRTAKEPSQIDDVVFNVRYLSSGFVHLNGDGVVCQGVFNLFVILDDVESLP